MPNMSQTDELIGLFPRYSEWVSQKGIGDHASILGLLITLVGFWLTFLKKEKQIGIR